MIERKNVAEYPKYRAYIRSENKIVNVDVLNLMTGQICINYEARMGAHLIYGLHEITLLPFTGRYDKDGKEIYYLDVIEARDCDLETYNDWLVTWDKEEAAFFLRCISLTDKSIFPFMDVTDIKHQGSVYEVKSPLARHILEDFK